MSVSMKELAASLITAFALSAGGGNAAAAEPAKPAKPEVSKASVANFNDHAKATVFERNLNRDIRDEPILVKETGGRYLVHESATLGVLSGDGVGKLKSYNKDELEKTHGPLDNIRTYEQYKADSAILSKTPGLGRVLSEKAFDMPIRLKDLEGDMKAAGESFNPPAPKAKPGF